MSEQPITREQAIKKVREWRTGDYCLSENARVLDFLLRELEEKKAVEPVSYADLIAKTDSFADNPNGSSNPDMEKIAAVLRVVETRVEPLLKACVQYGDKEVAATLAALAQARRPT